MRVPISKRLLLSADLVPLGARVADVGCDHGYLGIHLLMQGIASFVTASDLRAKPLQAARENAEKFGTADRMRFVQADGLAGIGPEDADVIVCAGMGGDLIRMILEVAPWIRDGAHMLILQPQSGAHDLRRWMYDNAFSIRRERAALYGGFVYFAMEAVWTGENTPYTPGSLFLTPQMLESGSSVSAYLDRMVQSLDKTLRGLREAKEPGDRLDFYETAYAEIQEWKRAYDDGR